MKTLTLITFIALNVMTTAAQPSHPYNGKASMHSSIAGVPEVNSQVSDLSKIGTLTIYPNPAIRNVYAEVNSSQAPHATLKVINVIGNTIVTKGIDLTEGLNKITIEVRELESGIYFLKIEDAKALHLCQRFTKQS